MEDTLGKKLYILHEFLSQCVAVSAASSTSLRGHALTSSGDNIKDTQATENAVHYEEKRYIIVGYTL